MSYLSSGSRFRVEAVAPDDALNVLAAALRPDFLLAAGWDAGELMLVPPRSHPLLGVKQCARKDCTTGVVSRGRDLCRTCSREYEQGNVLLEEFLKTTSGRLVRGERFCVVTGCPRPTCQSTELCLSHNYRFTQHTSKTVEEWIQDARPTPMSSFGPCRVRSCSWMSAVPNRLCHPHARRWSHDRRTDPPLDLEVWAQSQEPPADSGGIVMFKGLPPQVITEILAGLQWRTDDHTKTSMTELRALVRHARQQKVSSLFDLLPTASETTRHVTALMRSLTLSVQRSLTTPEREQQRDRWDLAIFGCKGQINFETLSQPWLREAAKHWVAEDLPLHRGRQAAATSKQTIRALRFLSWSLEHGRPDHGLVPRDLGRTDIVRLTNRLALLERTDQISAGRRYQVATRIRRFLEDVRSFGLTIETGPLAGLPDDFRLRHSDVSRPPESLGPGRDLPIPVQRCINEHLPELERRAGLDVRRIVELLIDTGRRPEEACQLPWDCLDTTADGHHVLIYTDSKNNRQNLRLPIGIETADLIREHRENVRQRFPNTPLDQLALFPRIQLNPYGTFHVGVAHMSQAHRVFIDSIADELVDEAGQRFPAAVAVPYSYRHSYAQRHADNGTPPDVLRDLMGHVSMETTMGYYRVTEKRVRKAVNQVAQHQFDNQGRRVFADIAGLVAEEHARLRVGQVAVPFGVCTEPSNVKAGGHACPYKYSCIGCGHFRSDASYLPELKSYLQQLLADRERILAATDVQEWVRTKTAPSNEEINQLRALIRRVEDDLEHLSPADQQQIQEAIDVIRGARQKVSLGMPAINVEAGQR